MAYTGENFIPAGTCFIRPVPFRDGYLVQAPISLPALAYEWNGGSDSSIYEGRYLAPNSEIFGKPIKLVGDTWDDSWGGTPAEENTTTHVTCEPASVQWVDPVHKKYGCYFPDNSTTATATVTTTDTVGSVMPALDIWIRRGFSFDGISPSDVNTWETTIQTGAYTLVFKNGEKIALYYLDPVSDEQVMVQNLRDLGNAEDYVKGQNGLIRVQYTPDLARNQLMIEIGEGNFIRHSHDDKGGANPFPSDFNLVLTHTNGWAAYQIFEVQYGNASIQAKYKLPSSVDSSSEGYFAINSLAPLGTKNDNVSVDIVPQVDGDGTISDIDVSVQVANDYDSDTDYGSTLPSRLIDGTIIVPAVWSQGVPDGTETDFIVQRPTKSIHHVSIFDDNNRFVSSYGSVELSNRFGQYTAGYRRRAIEVQLSRDNLVTSAVVCEGVSGGDTGLEFEWQGVPYVRVPYTDNSQKMLVPLGQRVVFDGWEISCAMRFLLERGNIFWQAFTNPYNPLTGTGTFPTWYTPANTPYYAPYAPATEDVPPDAFVLGRGTGNAPRYEFQADAICWDVALQLCQEVSSPYTGEAYMMGFDALGMFHFKPFDPFLAGYAQPTFAYDTNPQSSIFNTIDVIVLSISEISVTNNVDWMRSEITFQGLDTQTNELIQAHVDMPAYVKESLGWRSVWCERKGAWSTQEYLEYLIARGKNLASLATQVIQFTCTLNPYVFVGDTIFAADRYQIGGAGAYMVIRVEHIQGVHADGVHKSASTIIHARLLDVLA